VLNGATHSEARCKRTRKHTWKSIHTAEYFCWLMMLLFTVQDLVGEAGVSYSEGYNGAPNLEGLSVLFLHGECVL
jgi:hypothetical protein